MTDQPTKVEVPNSTCCGNMKGVEKLYESDGLEWLGSPKVSETIAPFDRAHTSSC